MMRLLVRTGRNRSDVRCMALGVFFFGVMPLTCGAQSTDAWSVTTSGTGLQTFDSVQAAEAALHALGAAESHLTHSGRTLSTETTTTLYYVAAPARRGVEEPQGVQYGFAQSNTGQCVNSVFPWQPATISYEGCVPLGGWYNTYAQAEAYLAGVLWPGCGPTQSVVLTASWTADSAHPTTAQSNLMEAWNPLSGSSVAAGCPWSQFTDQTAVGALVRRSSMGFSTCPAGYTFDPASNDCFNPATAEIYLTNLTDAEDCPVGNPCLPSNGVKVQSELDYAGDVGIRFERTYRSDYQSNPRNSVLGPGWMHSYESSLRFNPTTGQPNRALLSNGRIVRLMSAGVDLWRGVGGSLTVTRSGSEYRLYLGSGAYEVYDATGLLTKTVDSAGRETQLTYADVGPHRLLARVKGPYGHTLSLRWQNAGSLSSPSWRLSRVTAPAGLTIQYVYTTGAAVLREVIYQDATRKQYLYEEAGLPAHLTGMIDERQIRYATFDYDSRGRATLSEHAGGYERWTLGYSANDVTTTDARLISSTYGFQPGVGSGRFVGAIERVGTSVSRTNEPGALLRLTSSTDRRGIETRYAYDSWHLTSITDAYGTSEARETTIQYLNDTSELPRFERRPSVCQDGPTRTAEVETQYVAGTQLVSARIERGFVRDSVTSVCSPIERTTQYLNYNNKGNPRLINGPRGGVSDNVAIEYNPCPTGAESGAGCGQVATITNAAGHTWTFNAYNAHGQVTELTRPNGVVLTYGYDPRQRLRTITATASGSPARTTHYDYYDNGLPERVTDPTGAYVEYTYNDARLLTEIRDNSGNRIEYGYDPAGNRTSETIRDLIGTITSSRAMGYDDFNWLNTVSLPRPTGGFDVWDYEFDPTGLLQSVTSPEGRTTSYDDYDALGRLRSFVNALDQRTTYGYDAHDNVVSVTALTTPSYPAGVVTSYIYDDFGRLARETSADRGVLTHSYDEADNHVLTADARGLSTDYVYDVLNRLTTIQIEPQGGGVQETLSIVYDDTTLGGRRGQIVSASAQSGTLAYAYGYDAFGRRISEQLSYAGLSAASLTQYTYDAADRIEEIRRGTPTQPNLWVTRNVRDTAGLITDIEDRRSSPADVIGGVQHAPFGPYVAMTFGNAHEVSRALDQRYRVSNSNLAAVENVTLTWTPDDNLEAKFRTGPGVWPPNLGYEHDALNRTLTATDGFWTAQVDYGVNGDYGRLSKIALSASAPPHQTVVSRNYTYAPQTNRLTQILNNVPSAIYPVTSDASGNLTGSAMLTQGHEYDSLSQLRRAYPAGSSGTTTALYDFNPFGERARKQTSNGSVTQVTLYSYLSDGKLLGETIYDNNVLAEQRDYVWMDATPVAMHVTKLDTAGVPSADEIYYLHSDHLGTPRRATNAAGATVWALGGDEYFFLGEMWVQNSAGGPISPINLRFPGQYFDAETGLNYNYYRSYWPLAGRYVQHDPIGLAGGPNPYLYANGNPLANTDPSGLQPRGQRPRAPSTPMNDPFLRRMAERDMAMQRERMEQSHREREARRQAFEAAKEGLLPSPGQSFVDSGHRFGDPLRGPLTDLKDVLQDYAQMSEFYKQLGSDEFFKLPEELRDRIRDERCTCLPSNGHVTNACYSNANSYVFPQQRAICYCFP